jgi:hypothetical protein
MISGDLVNKREKSSTSIIYTVNIYMYIEKKNKSSSSYVGHIVAFNFPPKNTLRVDKIGSILKCM